MVEAKGEKIIFFSFPKDDVPESLDESVKCFSVTVNNHIFFFSFLVELHDEMMGNEKKIKFNVTKNVLR